MSAPNDRFKSRPPRRIVPARPVSLSAEDRKAYEELIRERDKRDATYERHLAPADVKRSR